MIVFSFSPSLLEVHFLLQFWVSEWNLVYLQFQVSGELSAASPERLSMASPAVGGGKRVHNLPYSSDVNQSRTSLPLLTMTIFIYYDCYFSLSSCLIVIWGAWLYSCAANSGLGNVAWKERVDGWKMKQEKNVVPMSTGQAASERGAGDIDASTDVLVDDSLLWVFHLFICKNLLLIYFCCQPLDSLLCWYQVLIFNGNMIGTIFIVIFIC